MNIASYASFVSVDIVFPRNAAPVSAFSENAAIVST